MFELLSIILGLIIYICYLCTFTYENSIYKQYVYYFSFEKLIITGINDLCITINIANKLLRNL